MCAAGAPAAALGPRDDVRTGADGAWFRDLGLRLYPPKWALRQIIRSMRTPF